MQAIMRSKFFYWISILLIGAIFALGYINGSNFEIICAVCAALFWLIQLRPLFGLDKEENVQRKRCKPAGFFLLLPAIGMIAAGIYILFWSYMSVSLEMTYCVIALSSALSVCLLFQIVALWKNNSLSGRFLRLTIVAAISAPMSLIVVRILHFTQSDEAAVLSCMSTVVFGVVAFLIAVNLVMVSICGYKSTRNSIKTISDLIKSKKLVFTRVSILKDIFLVTGKSIISIISLSFFMFVNALYNTGMGVARFIAVKMHTQDRKEQITSYRSIQYGNADVTIAGGTESCITPTCVGGFSALMALSTTENLFRASIPFDKERRTGTCKKTRSKNLCRVSGVWQYSGRLPYNSSSGGRKRSNKSDGTCN